MSIPSNQNVTPFSYILLSHETPVNSKIKEKCLNHTNKVGLEIIADSNQVDLIRNLYKEYWTTYSPDYSPEKTMKNLEDTLRTIENFYPEKNYHSLR